MARPANRWSALRAIAKDSPAAWREQAITTFTNGLAVGAGKKPTAQHYNDLFQWHLRKSQFTREALSERHRAITSFVFTASQISDSLRMAMEGATPEFLRQQQPALVQLYEIAPR